MAKEKDKKKHKKHKQVEEEVVEKKAKRGVKEKKISKKHKHKSEKCDKPEKKSKKTKRKHEKSEAPKPELAAPNDSPSTPIPMPIHANDMDSDSDYDPEEIRQLLESYSKEDLVDLICRNADKGSRLISTVLETAERDITQRKIFVRGFGWDTTRENLLAAFEPYGEIEECSVIMDKDTGRAKGYGFVLFKTRKGVKKALKNPQKKMYNRTVVCNYATERPAGAGKGRETTEQVKIDLNQMPNNQFELSGFDHTHGHAINKAPQHAHHSAGSAVFAGQNMPFYGQAPGFNPMYGAVMGNQMVSSVPNYAVYGSGMMNQGMMVPPNNAGMAGQYVADGNAGERAWYLRQQ